MLTFEVHRSRVGSLDPDGLVVGPVALQPGGGGGAPAHEALLTLEHQHGPVGQVEVEAGFVLRGVFAVGEEVAGALAAQQLAVVGAERDGAVLVPAQLEQGVGTPVAKRL